MPTQTLPLNTAYVDSLIKRIDATESPAELPKLDDGAAAPPPPCGRGPRACRRRAGNGLSVFAYDCDTAEDGLHAEITSLK